jgi:hypothetical protein
MADIATLGIEVKTAGVEEATAELTKLSGAAARAEAAVDGFEAASQGATGAASSAAAGYTKQGAAAAVASKQVQLMTKAANDNKDSFKVSAADVENLAGMLKDVGVSAATSVSPLEIALDKGFEMAMMFGPMGAAGAVKTLGAAFNAIVNPLSLVTMGVVYAGAALVQMFMDGGSAAEKAEKDLKAFDALLQRIGEHSEEAEARIKKMQNVPLSSNALLADITEMEAALKADLADATSDLGGALERLRVYVRAPVEPELRSTRNAMADLGRELNAGGLTARDVYERLSAIRTAETTPSSLYETLKTLRENALAAAVLEAKLKSLGNFYATEDDRSLKGDRDPFVALQKKADDLRNSSELLKRMGIFDTAKLQSDLNSQTKDLRPSAEANANASSAFSGAVESVRERTEALVAQNEAQKNLNPLVNDYGYSLTKAKTAAELLAAAEQDKKKITPELTADIDKQAEALAQATVEQNKLNEATTKAKAALDFAKGAATGFLSTLRQGLVSGEGWFKSLGNAALSVLDKIASKIEETFVNALFSTNGGGFNLFSFLTGGAAAAAGGGSVGGGAAASAKVAASVARPAAPRNAAPPARTVAQGQGVHVTIGLKKDGLNISPEVVGVARNEAGRAAGAVKAGFETWRRNEQHRDIEKHIANRRVIGR